MLRRLRIAVSVLFALVAVALCALWVRSYTAVTNIQTTVGPNRGFQFVTKPGSLYFHSYSLTTKSDKDEFLSGVWSMHKGTEEFDRWTNSSPPVVVPPPFQFAIGYYNLPGELLIRFPHWFGVLVAGVLAMAFGATSLTRFSLRTLLVGMTLFAVALGLGVWLVS